MKRQLNWILAASIGVGAFTLAGCDRDDGVAVNTDNTTPNQTVTSKEDASRTAGSQIPGDQIGAMDLNNIYATLGDTVEAAVTKNGFDDMVERLAEEDRKQIGDFKDQDFKDLDGRIDQFRNDFKAKYNADFAIDDKVFSDWVRVTKESETADVTRANAVIPASHGRPEVTIPLVKDNMKWRVNIPNELSAAKLKSEVLTHLTKLDESKAQWPADQLEAKRAIVHQMYMGLMGTKAGAGAGQGNAG